MADADIGAQDHVDAAGHGDVALAGRDRADLIGVAALGVAGEVGHQSLGHGSRKGESIGIAAGVPVREHRRDDVDAAEEDAGDAEESAGDQDDDEYDEYIVEENKDGVEDLDDADDARFFAFDELPPLAFPTDVGYLRSLGVDVDLPADG